MTLVDEDINLILADDTKLKKKGRKKLKKSWKKLEKVRQKLEKKLERKKVEEKTLPEAQQTQCIESIG